MKDKNDGQIQFSGQPVEEPQGPEIATDGKNVSALVTKSKKAASTLFTLLHAKVGPSLTLLLRKLLWSTMLDTKTYCPLFSFRAQNCKLGVHRCTHPGCAEAKLIYLHLKTCPSSTSLEPCPANRTGCADSRKLINHYRRCRDIRARQIANRTREPQHVCLVCSLVARHAKGSLDRSRSISPNCGRASIMPPPPTKFSFSNRLTKQAMNVSFHVNPAEDIPELKISGGLRHRPRSESLDSRRSPPRDLEYPTQESNTSHSLRNNRDNLEEGPIVHRRRRSASCSVPSSSNHVAGSIDPILEEPVGDELQRILEGDSCDR